MKTSRLVPIQHCNQHWGVDLNTTDWAAIEAHMICPKCGEPGSVVACGCCPTEDIAELKKAYLELAKRLLAPPPEARDSDEVYV